MQTNFLVLDPAGVACRVSSVADDWTCRIIPMDGGGARTAKADTLRPLKRVEAARAALDAAVAAKNWSAAKACEVAISLIEMEAAGFIPAFHARTTLEAVFGGPGPYAVEAA